MTDPLDLDEMERKWESSLSTMTVLVTELRQIRKERDEALEKVHFYEVQYQDEIGINGLIEERDAALATVAAQKAEIERLKVQLKEMDQHSDAVYAALKERDRLEDEDLVTAKRLIASIAGMSGADWYTLAGALDSIRREERERIDRPERQALFIDGEFTAHSGDALPFKIDCDALTDGDIATLAAEIARRVQFASVMGIPRGGLRLAAALERYRDLSQSTKGVLIVDDVLTTGRSMVEARRGLGSNVKGAVIFARGPCPDWITPLFTMGSGTDGSCVSAGQPAVAQDARPIIIHETVPVLVWADADRRIAPFVTHLNSIHGVRTYASCQGTIGEGGAEPYPPFVSVGWWTAEARNRLLEYGLVEEGAAFGTVYPSVALLDGLSEILPPPVTMGSGPERQAAQDTIDVLVKERDHYREMRRGLSP